MPRRTRRALLELLGTGTAALLAGCPTDPGTERSTPTATVATATPTTSPAGTATAAESPPGPPDEPATATESPAEAPEAVECAAVSRPEAAWPVPRRSPARDGYVADPDGFEDAPASVWEAEPSKHDDTHAYASYGQPVVGGDGLYLTNQLDKGPQRVEYGHVHALDAETGDRRWASERFRSPSSPVVWKDLAVVVAQDEDFNAMVVAFDRADGTRRWTRQFAARDTGFVTAGDHLYLALEGTARGTVLALAEDGSTVWRREGAFADHVNEGPVVGPDALYLATPEGRLHALARDDGSTGWTHRFEHPTERRPYVSDIVATACSLITVVEGAVKAFDDGGNLVWEADDVHGSLATDGERLYAPAGLDDDRELRALDAATGEVRWTVGGRVRTPPVVAGDAVYVRLDGSIAALDRADGTERWRTDGSLGDLALADGTLYGTRQGTLVALR